MVGWKETLSAPSSPPSAATGAGNVDEIAKDLFGGEDLSFETRTKFNSKYAGTRINWPGRVKQVRQSKGKTQATITVATVDNDLYGNTDIAVVVEDVTGPVPSEGQTLTISGTLDTIDPLMRNLFVADATFG